MKKVTHALRTYGDWMVRNMDRDGYYDTNVLWRYAREGLVQKSGSRDKILCPDMPPDIREVDVAIRKLPNWQMKCDQARFCAPIKDDGNLYTHREIAQLLHLSYYKYKQFLRSGIRQVEIALNLDY